jgi:talin
LNFDEQILEAAKSIAVATKFLVQSASAAQKELVLQGRMNITGHSMDKSGQFSHGLVSAAQMVAAATGSMCEAANDLVVGQASEEK